MYLDLYDTDGPDDLHINKAMFEKKFAKETQHTVENPWNIEATVAFNPHQVTGLPG